jgi:hypothetical protein
MTDSIRIEVARACDTDDVIDALGAHGMDATLVEAGEGVEIAVPSEGDVSNVSHALDDWAAARGVPFVAVPCGERRLTVRPPGD